jgi:hypothetical protein
MKKKAYDKIIEILDLSKHDDKNNKVDEQILSKGDFKFHAVVQGDLWQAAEPIGDFVLVGCTVAPGWELDDEAYLSDYAKTMDKLLKLRPDLKRHQQIRAFKNLEIFVIYWHFAILAKYRSIYHNLTSGCDGGKKIKILIKGRELCLG